MLQTIAQSEQRIKKPIKKKNALVFEEFIEFYRNEALPAFQQKIKEGAIPAITIRPASTRNDDNQIIQIYNELYDG